MEVSSLLALAPAGQAASSGACPSARDRIVAELLPPEGRASASPSTARSSCFLVQPISTSRTVGSARTGRAWPAVAARGAGGAHGPLLPFGTRPTGAVPIRQPRGDHVEAETPHATIFGTLRPETAVFGADAVVASLRWPACPPTSSSLARARIEPRPAPVEERSRIMARGALSSTSLHPGRAPGATASSRGRSTSSLALIGAPTRIFARGRNPGPLRPWSPADPLFGAHGFSSSLAAASLHDLGFEHATDLAGGFAAWHEAGLGSERAGGAGRPARRGRPRSRSQEGVRQARRGRAPARSPPWSTCPPRRRGAARSAAGACAFAGPTPWRSSSRSPPGSLSPRPRASRAGAQAGRAADRTGRRPPAVRIAAVGDVTLGTHASTPGGGVDELLAGTRGLLAGTSSSATSRRR